MSTEQQNMWGEAVDVQSKQVKSGVGDRPVTNDILKGIGDRIIEQVLALQDIPSTREQIRGYLLERRQQRLAERYTELSKVEPAFMDMVSRPVDWDNIRPELHWVDPSTARLWWYARNIVSSAPDEAVIGRRLDWYFTDSNSGRWMGIGRIASPTINMSPRYDLLHWAEVSKTQQGRYLRHITNITVCICVQPFGTLLAGKLMATSVFSNEFRAKYEKEYGDTLLGIETTSLYGKSSMYNRLSELRFAGLTQGMGSFLVPEEVYQDMLAYVNLHPGFNPGHNTSSPKLKRIGFVLRKLGLSSSSQLRRHQRGYYWGVTAANSEDILCGKNGASPDYIDRPLADLTAHWRERWYKMRLPKKRQEVESFDVNVYRLDNNVPLELRGPRQTHLL